MASTEITGQQGVVKVSAAVLGHGWFFRENTTFDQGIDGQIEVAADGVGASRLLAVQIKAGQSYFKRETATGWSHPVSERHAAYWTGGVLPVIVTLVDLDGDEIYWQEVTPQTLRRRGKSFVLEVPREQTLRSPTSWTQLDELANWDASSLNFEGLLRRLPPTVVTRLRKVHSSDPRTAGRLASALAATSAPEDVLTSIAASPPNWAPPHATLLWRTIAAFAEEHFLWQTARELLEATGATGSGMEADECYLRAAALSIAEHDPDKTQALLDKLSEPTAAEPWPRFLQALLQNLDDQDSVYADPEWDTPESLADVALIGARAEHGLMRRDVLTAVRLAERVITEIPESSTALSLIARARFARSRTLDAEPGDIEQACTLMQTAVDQRRAWGGTTEGMLETLAQLYGVLGDNQSIIDNCATDPHGRAGEEEGTRPEIAQFVVFAATAMSDKDLIEEYLNRIDDAPRARRTRALISLQGTTDVSAAQSFWDAELHAAIDDTNAADAAEAAQELAWLGIDRSDSLSSFVSDGSLHDEDLALIRAHSNAVAGSVSQLRTLARQQLNAARMLVAVHQRRADYAAAAEAAQDARERFDTYELVDTEIRSLFALTRPADAAQVAAKTLQSKRPSAEQRAIAYRALAHAAASEDRWSDAERHYRDARNEHPLAQTDAWNFAVAYLRLNRADLAAQVIDDENLVPDALSRAVIWLSAKSLGPWTDQDFRTAIRVAETHAETDLSAKAATHALMRSADSPWHSSEEVEAGRDETWGQRLAAQIALHSSPEANAGLQRVEKVEEIFNLVRDAATRDEWRRRAILRLPRADAPTGIVAHLLGRPYASVYGNKIAGWYPVGADNADVHKAEMATVTGAFDGPVIVDASALIVGAVLNDENLRDEFRSVRVPQSVLSDFVESAEDARNDMRSANTMSWDYTSQRPVLLEKSEADRKRSEEAQRRYVDLATSITADTTPLTGDLPLDGAVGTAWSDSIRLAHQTSRPLWSDDIGQRAIAGSVGVSSFSTLALLDALVERDEPAKSAEVPDGSDPRSAHRKKLAEMGAVGVPLTVNDILTLARSDGWSGEVASLPLARPAWWASQRAPLRALAGLLSRVSREAGPDALLHFVSRAAEAMAQLVLGTNQNAALNLAVVGLVAWRSDPDSSRARGILECMSSTRWLFEVQEPELFLDEAARLLEGNGIDVDAAAFRSALSVNPGEVRS